MKAKTGKTITIAVAGLLITVFTIKYIIPKPDLVGKIENLRERTKPRFDSLSNQMNEDNQFHANVRQLIETKNFEIANKLVDSAMKKKPNNFLYTYKGMILAGQGNHQAAIELYNKSASLNGEYPYTLIKRATSFLALNDFENAIADCKKAAAVNHQFNIDVGNAYEQANLTDSAITYFSKYLNHYPEAKEVRQRLDYLTSRNKK